MENVTSPDRLGWGTRIKRQKILARNPELSLAGTANQKDKSSLVSKQNSISHESIRKKDAREEKGFGLSIFSQENY